MSAVPAATTTRSGVVGAHLVGSINLPDVETTFGAVAEHLGEHLRRVPDGEVGDRFNWIVFQTLAFDRTPGLSRIPIPPIVVGDFDMRPFQIDEGFDPAELEITDLGYASAAKESYEVFTRLRSEGVIRPGTRFQVSLPTPTACIAAFFVAEVRAAVEPAYRDAILNELAEIVASIPNQDLAIQWDVAVEFQLVEGATYPGMATHEPWFDGDVTAGCVARIARVADQVPAGVELGFHLCYGDLGETHFTEPVDTANLTKVANAIVSAVDRDVDFIHLPVPIERDDVDYYQPLEDLKLPDGTELYLGLVHREDGAEGANRRIDAALQVVDSFGVATECGCGRAPKESTIPLLQTHAAVASPIA